MTENTKQSEQRITENTNKNLAQLFAENNRKNEENTKRLLEENNKQIERNITKTMTENITRIAVSYTHLDVYKRQTLSRSYFTCQLIICHLHLLSSSLI